MSESVLGMREAFERHRQRKGISPTLALHGNVWFAESGLAIAWTPRIDEIRREKDLREGVFFPALREVNKINDLDIVIGESARLTEVVDIESRMLGFEGLLGILGSVITIGEHRDYHNLEAATVNPETITDIHAAFKVSMLRIG